jgi:hypothetical protein
MSIQSIEGSEYHAGILFTLKAVCTLHNERMNIRFCTDLVEKLGLNISSDFGSSKAVSVSSDEGIVFGDFIKTSDDVFCFRQTV